MAEVVNDSADFAWCYFFNEKLEKKMMGLIKNLRAKYGIQVQYARCDNAWENEDFDWPCKQEGMGVKFQYTAPGIPQQNDQIKWKFATLFNRVHAISIMGNFVFLRNSLWAEAANTATFLENKVFTPMKDLSPF